MKHTTIEYTYDYIFKPILFSRGGTFLEVVSCLKYLIKLFTRFFKVRGSIRHWLLTVIWGFFYALIKSKFQTILRLGDLYPPLPVNAFKKCILFKPIKFESSMGLIV